MIVAAGCVTLRGSGDGATAVLVVHRTVHEDWSLPKGHLDPGERVEDAAVREVREETGVDVTIVGPLDTTHYETAAGPKRVHWFLAHAIGGDPASRPPDGEVDVARWIDTAVAASILTHPDEAGLVALAVDRRPAPPAT